MNQKRETGLLQTSSSIWIGLYLGKISLYVCIDSSVHLCCKLFAWGKDCTFYLLRNICYHRRVLAKFFHFHFTQPRATHAMHETHTANKQVRTIIWYHPTILNLWIWIIVGNWSLEKIGSTLVEYSIRSSSAFRGSN